MKNIYKIGKYCIWEKRFYKISKYVSELEWVWDVNIVYRNGVLVVSGMEEDVWGCLCVVDSLLLRKGKEDFI